MFFQIQIPKVFSDNAHAKVERLKRDFVISFKRGRQCPKVVLIILKIFRFEMESLRMIANRESLVLDTKLPFIQTVGEPLTMVGALGKPLHHFRLSVT